MIRPITKTLLALGCVGTLASTASAQLPTTYTQGDYLVGFREVGNTNSVVVDIGPLLNINLPEVFTIDAGTTLTAQYGSTWSSNPNVFFSLASADSADTTNYVTSAQYLTGPNAGPAKIWSRLTSTNSNNFRNKINLLGSEFNSAGEVEPKTDPNAYANYMPGGTTDAGHANSNIAWGYFNPTTEGNFSQGTTGVALNLIQLQPGSGPGADVGAFDLSMDGNTLTYIPAVPEPSSFVALAAIGALAFLGFRVNNARKSSTNEQFA